MTTIIETPRLRLRKWKEEDLVFFEKMNSDPDVMRYFPSPLNKQQSLDLAYKIQQELEEKSYGLFAAELKKSSTFIGFIGLHHQDFSAPFTPCIEIGWRLAKEFWNLGLATEGAQATLDYAFNSLKLPEIVSFTAKINFPSIRVMEKIGLNFETNFLHPKLPPDHPLTPHVLYKKMNNFLI